MKEKLMSNRIKIASLVLAAALFAAVAFAFPTETQAHCDSYHGPVAQAALTSLDSGDVSIVLPYVDAEAEDELRAAFRQARDVRKMGPKARELADKYFVETAVRLHRMSEGAAYTGVTDEPVPPAIEAADRAMDSGSVDEVHAMLAEALAHGLEERLHQVEEARAEAARLGTVEAHRERVHAELSFEAYVYGIHEMISGAEVHAEGGDH
jgi:hypothetical protein